MSQPPLDLRFVTSADRWERLPPTAAEVAFLGRSNVGKSSLLNKLANRTRLAHVSKTPGRTQLLNCFELGASAAGRPVHTLVDCPGYGFAKVPAKVKQRWQAMLEDYLLERAELVRALVLVDGEIGPTELDVSMLDWLRHHEVPFAVVASKHDKVKSSKREARKQDLAIGCGVRPADVVWTSSAKDVGIDRLRALIRTWLDEGSERASASAPSATDPTEPYDDEAEWD
jgi:GTP-binding protein